MPSIALLIDMSFLEKHGRTIIRLLLLNELSLLHNCSYIIYYYHMSSSTVISCRDITAPTDDSIVNAISNANAAVA